jgi:hypothetical protein
MATAVKPKRAKRATRVATYLVRVIVRGEGGGDIGGGIAPTNKYVAEELAKELHRLTGFEVTATATRTDK